MNLIQPEIYPILPIAGGLLLVIATLYIVCYRYINPTNIFLIAFTGMIFLHLDLLFYEATYPLYTRVIDFFVMDHIRSDFALLIRLTALVILILPPLLTWFIPMVMMDEKLTGNLCESELVTRTKSALILGFGIAINTVFAITVLKSQLPG